MDLLESLAKGTNYSKEMQRYYLACIDEFGPDFKQFVETLIIIGTQQHDANSSGCEPA
jgi:hypothetical protein